MSSKKLRAAHDAIQRGATCANWLVFVIGRPEPPGNIIWNSPEAKEECQRVYDVLRTILGDLGPEWDDLKIEFAKANQEYVKIDDHPHSSLHDGVFCVLEAVQDCLHKFLDDGEWIGLPNTISDDSLHERLTKEFAQASKGEQPLQSAVIPPEKRTKPMSKIDAAKLLGRTGNPDRARDWLNKCIEDGIIRYQPTSRQSGFFHLDDFPPELDERLKPQK